MSNCQWNRFDGQSESEVFGTLLARAKVALAYVYHFAKQKKYSGPVIFVHFRLQSSMLRSARSSWTATPVCRTEIPTAAGVCWRAGNQTQLYRFTFSTLVSHETAPLVLHKQLSYVYSHRSFVNICQFIFCGVILGNAFICFKVSSPIRMGIVLYLV